MVSETAVGSEIQQAVAVLFAQPELAGNSTEVELAGGGLRRRACCRLFNEPVTVQFLTIAAVANDCREVVTHAVRYFLQQLRLLIEDRHPERTLCSSKRTQMELDEGQVRFVSLEFLPEFSGGSRRWAVPRSG